MTPSVFTIPFGVPFLETLALQILLETKKDPFSLSLYRIYLPTQRACRTLKNLLLSKSGRDALLLPQIIPLGADDPLSLLNEQQSLPPLASLARQGLLMKLLLAHPKFSAASPQALKMSQDLATLMDQACWADVDLNQLDTLVPADYADHWQHTLDFLKILTTHWPLILKDMKQEDPSLFRKARLKAQACKEEDCPSESPVIVAGVTWATPAIIRLIKALLQQPQGRLILPGVDLALKAELWDELKPTHSQYGFKNLLHNLGFDRDKIKLLTSAEILPTTKPHPQNSERITNRTITQERVQFIAHTQDYLTLNDTHSSPATLPELFKHCDYIPCSSSAEEAKTIALILRETLETPGKTAALVTPDRTLARQVCAELERWKILVNDSAGQPLHRTPAGRFVLLLVKALFTQENLQDLLALLKHPWSIPPNQADFYKKSLQELEIRKLRGIGHFKSYAELLNMLYNQKDLSPAISTWLSEFQQTLATLPFDSFTTPHSFSSLCETVEKLLLRWAPDALNTQEDGKILSVFLDNLKEHQSFFPDIPPQDFAEILKVLMKDHKVRKTYGYHPRLFIWGPLEAQLHSPDCTVLGGLNEGVWPGLQKEDPWLSQGMRVKMGLPCPEETIGRAAHDFLHNLGASEVFITRSLQKQGAPTVPCRWISHLQTALEAMNASALLAPMSPWVEWQATLDTPEQSAIAIKSPRPCPPIQARPRQFSVTDIETLSRDPYSFYAKRILKLSPLPELTQEIGPLERGTFIHASLERFINEAHTPQDCFDLERLLKIGRETLGPLYDQAIVHGFWWPRFKRMAAWFINEEEKQAKNKGHRFTEVEGYLTFKNENEEPTCPPLVLKARADRIDILQNGGVEIIDYKTGSMLPSSTDIENGFSPQLPLEGAITLWGKWTKLPPGRHPLEGLSFWQLTGGATPGKIRNISDPQRRSEQMLYQLKRIVSFFTQENQPYISTPENLNFPEYEHLARVKETQS